MRTNDDLSPYVRVPRWQPLNYPKLVVETVASGTDLQRIFEHTRAVWSELGESEPYFTSVAHDRFRATSIAENTHTFFQTGFESWTHIAAIGERCGVDVKNFRNCLELGCGAGRMTRALSETFEKIYALDISESHLSVAARHLRECGITNVVLKALTELASIDAMPEVDLFLSFSVLQHNPPPLAATLLEKSLARLRLGGVAYFQCQTYQLNYNFRVDDYVNGIEKFRHRSAAGWEMHALPQATIFDILQRLGFSILEVREDGALHNGVSQIFFVRRDACV